MQIQMTEADGVYDLKDLSTSSEGKPELNEGNPTFREIWFPAFSRKNHEGILNYGWYILDKQLENQYPNSQVGTYNYIAKKITE